MATDEMARTYRTIRAFFEGDPNCPPGGVEWGMDVLGGFLTMPHHGSEPVMGVALKCGYLIAENGDLLHARIPTFRLPADDVAEFFANYAAHAGELADLPTTEP